MKNMIAYRTFYRLALSAGLVIALCAGLATLAPVRAQDGGQPIAVGEIVTGSLNSENFVQIYTLSASAGDSISIDVSTEVEDLALVVVVTDEGGTVVVQDVDTGTPLTATIAEFELPSSGTFYIMVMRGSGASGDASGSFTLRLSGFQQIGGQTVTLTEGGIVFDLVWNAAVNLNVEVRDPVGGTVHRLRPGAPSGGTLDADVNSNCDAALAAEPTETIAWPAGTVPVGSYEIIIYYADACAVGGPQVFTLNTSVNGETVQDLTGTLNPGQEYLARLAVEADGDWRLVNGGVNAGLDVSIFSDEIANADPVAVGSTVSGLITNAAPAQAYTFTATAGTTVNVSLEALTGSLDTYLVLLGPDSTPLVSNDDLDDSTNSAVSRSLAADGTYTIIATRYGLTIGGTEGEYNLTVTSQTETAAAGTPAPTGEAGATPTAAEELPNGAIEVKLEWATQADLQLLVRDPGGRTVFDDLPLSESGGVLERDGNVGCLAPTDTPVSYIYWPPNRLQTGVYEVEVWYQNTCNDTRPVNFGLAVNVNEQTIINTSQPSSPNSRYMITFTVGQDLTVVAGPGNFFDMTNAGSLNYQAAFSTAIAISYGQTVSGSITAQQRFVVYSFEGQVGDIVTIGMNAQLDSTLDPALYLISPEQIQIDYNDDVEPNVNSNSVLDEVTLPSTGTYYIIATHYGLDVGGTQGTFNLTLVQD
jgi:hypothetical protein